MHRVPIPEDERPDSEAFTPLHPDCLSAPEVERKLAGVREREQLLAIRDCTTLPLLLGNTPPAINDPDFLAASGVRIALTGHLPFLASVKATYDALRHLKEGGTPEALREKVASEELMALATGREEYARWQKEYLS